MLDKIKQILEFSSKNGLYLPAAYDADKEGPSVSLLFSHVANMVAIISIIYLVIKDTSTGTLAAIIYASLMLVFYLMRRITKFKADLDDGSLELENEEEKK